MRVLLTVGPSLSQWNIYCRVCAMYCSISLWVIKLWMFDISLKHIQSMFINACWVSVLVCISVHTCMLCVFSLWYVHMCMAACLLTPKLSYLLLCAGVMEVAQNISKAAVIDSDPVLSQPVHCEWTCMLTLCLCETLQRELSCWAGGAQLQHYFSSVLLFCVCCRL